MLKTEEGYSEAPSRTWREKVQLADGRLREAHEEAKALGATDRYWRRDFPLSVLVALPILLAFDQSLRYGLIHGWVKPDVFTAFVLRPALVYIAGRSLVKWLRVDFRGFGIIAAIFAGLDWMTFKADPLQVTFAVFGTTLILFLGDVLLDPVKPKKTSRSGV